MLKNVINIVDSKNDCILIVNSPGLGCSCSKLNTGQSQAQSEEISGGDNIHYIT